jgi:hypothetical protein
MSHRPTLITRVAVGCAIGCLVFFVTHAFLAAQPARIMAADFTFWWRAARALMDGQSPYSVIQATGPYPFSDPFYYPLPAALVTWPLAWMSARTAAATFTGISSALLAFGLCRDGYARLPLLLSAPMASAILVGQWSPLIMASAVLPAFGWLVVAKPNLGIAVFLYRPSWVAVLGGSALLVVSWMVLPGWLSQWRQVVAHTPLHYPPISLLGGPILLLALLKWRTPEARLLLAMTLLPQSYFFYDQLPVLLVCRTVGESALLASLSVAGLLLAEHAHGAATRAVVEHVNAMFTMALIYLPALVILLRRPSDEPAGISASIPSGFWQSVRRWNSAGHVGQR